MTENKFGLAKDLHSPMKGAFEKVLSYVFINKVKNVRKTQKDDSENIIRGLLARGMKILQWNETGIFPTHTAHWPCMHNTCISLCILYSYLKNSPPVTL